MVLPIVAYGDPVLKKVAKEIEKGHPGLDQVIADMFETMYAANGVGLAAPQVGKSIRLFVVDASPFAEDGEEGTEGLKDFKKVFINPVIKKEEGEEWAFNEGCLSIPGIREEVFRKEKISIEYMDENFKSHKEQYDGYAARVVQHEYDHLQGVLFVEKISLLRRQLLKGKLANITKGVVDVSYKMRFPKK
ncbi:MAG: peptide deformylase [Bacteroidota bacterium]